MDEDMVDSSDGEYEYESGNENDEVEMEGMGETEEKTNDILSEYEMKIIDMPPYLRILVPKVDLTINDHVALLMHYKDGIVRYSVKKSGTKGLGPIIGIFEHAIKSEVAHVAHAPSFKSRKQMFDVVVQKLFSFVMFCPVCNELHVTPPERLVPCHKLSCLEKYITDKMGPDIKNTITHSPQYVDLIVSITYWALADGRFPERRDENFTPFPQQLVNKGKRSYDQVKLDLDALPSVEVLCDMIEGGSFDNYFADHLEVKEIFYVLEWILFSNRTALTYIEPAEMCTKERSYAAQAGGGRLFRVNNPPDVEAAFLQHKGSKATEWVYHGSNANCWHGILRNGLQIMSSTKYMTAGASYGAGIYLATDINTSLAYCKPAEVQWPQQKHLVSKCMLIGEFIPHGNTDDKGTVYPAVPAHFRIAREKKYFIARYLKLF